jgi:hypothetical protein
VDRRPGRIEHMSTQRRESSSTQVTKTRCRGSRNDWQRTDCTDREGADGLVSPAPVTRINCAYASAITARPFSTANLATKSLQKDPRFTRSVCHDSPPQWTHSRRQAYRYSLPPISILSGSVRFHLASPQAPAKNDCWAERYDGQGNLHFKHAA